LTDIPVAVMFPGLGSQHVGMGRDWYETLPVFRRTFEEGSDQCGLDLVRLCRERDQKAVLARQLEGQLALFVYGVAAYRALAEHLPSPPTHFVGHSLGELTALCAAGGLDFAQGVLLVKRRAEIVASVAAELQGTMVWVLNLPRDRVEGVCRSWRAQGRSVYLSAEDAPEQVAISGPRADIDEAVGTLERLGATIFPLRLRGPYHSPLMQRASDQLAALLQPASLPAPRGAVPSGVSAALHPGGAGSAELLASQLSSRVLWRQIVERLVADGVGLAVEVGPKAVLGFLVKKTAPGLHTTALDSFAHPAALVSAYQRSSLDPALLLQRCRYVLATSPAERGSSGGVAVGREVLALADEQGERALALTVDWLRQRGATEPALRSTVGALLQGRVLDGGRA
jgi:[acyl-carrier-protein] S-malonyltransferase